MKKSVLVIKESNAIARSIIGDPSVPIESVWNERIMALIAAQNITKDNFYLEHIIPITELNKGENISTSQYAEIKKTIKERTVRQTYVIPRGKKGFEAYPIFEYIELDDNGNIKVKLNQALCSRLLDSGVERVLVSPAAIT